MRGMHVYDISMKMECSYLYGWIKKTVTYAKISPKIVNSRSMAGNTEKEEEEEEEEEKVEEECMCAQTRPQFILSSEMVFGRMKSEPMVTPRNKSPLPESQR